MCFTDKKKKELDSKRGPRPVFGSASWSGQVLGREPPQYHSIVSCSSIRKFSNLYISNSILDFRTTVVCSNATCSMSHASLANYVVEMLLNCV